MTELIYREVVAVAGFDPEEDLTKPWSLEDAERRLHLSEDARSSADVADTDTADERQLLEDLCRRYVVAIPPLRQEEG